MLGARHAKRGEVTILRSEEFRNLHSIKIWLGWGGTCSMYENMRNACKITGNPEWKTSLPEPRRRRKDGSDGAGGGGDGGGGSSSSSSSSSSSV
jgi:hypothetical protein